MSIVYQDLIQGFFEFVKDSLLNGHLRKYLAMISTYSWRSKFQLQKSSLLSADIKISPRRNKPPCLWWVLSCRKWHRLLHNQEMVSGIILKKFTKLHLSFCGSLQLGYSVTFKALEWCMYVYVCVYTHWSKF